MNIQNKPPGATHWAPDTGEFEEAWYRFDEGVWYCVNDYWASDVTERPYGHAAKHWFKWPSVIRRPMTDLIELEK